MIINSHRKAKFDGRLNIFKFERIVFRYHKKTRNINNIIFCTDSLNFSAFKLRIKIIGILTFNLRLYRGSAGEFR